MELEYEGRALGHALTFSSTGRRQHTLVLRNVSRPSAAMLFKVQCTATRKLRVRPAMGFLEAAGDAVSVQVLLNPQDCTPATCKLLVLGRQASSTAAEVDGELLKAMWTAAEAQSTPETLVRSETISIRIRADVDVAANDDTAVTFPTQLTTTRLTTPQLAELVLLLIKSQSRRQENALTKAEQERLVTARAQYPTDWPCWEEYGARMRKLLRERNKRLTRAT